MLNADGRIVVVEGDGRSSEIDVYKTRLELVLDTLNNGRIGKKVGDHVGGWGTDDHIAAVRAVAKRADEILEKIEKVRREGFEQSSED